MFSDFAIAVLLFWMGREFMFILERRQWAHLVDRLVRTVGGRFNEPIE